MNKFLIALSVFLVSNIALANSGEVSDDYDLYNPPNVSRKLFPEESDSDDSDYLPGSEAGSSSEDEGVGVREATPIRPTTGLQIGATVNTIFARIPGRTEAFDPDSRPIELLNAGHGAVDPNPATIYMITVGDNHELPAPSAIWDLMGEQQDLGTLQAMEAAVRRQFAGTNILRYVVATTRDPEVHLQDIIRNINNGQETRMPMAVRAALTRGETVRWHLLAQNVHTAQLRRVGIHFRQALNVTGPYGLNIHAGHVEGQRGLRPSIETTPNTLNPATGTRQVYGLNSDGRLIPQAPSLSPVNWLNNIYVITPSGVDASNWPIIDLNDEELTQETLDAILDNLRARIDFNVQRYIGQVRAGENNDRTAATRFLEHSEGGIEHPYRRLANQVIRVNRATGQPVQGRVLVTGIHPSQIDFVEREIIRLFGGLDHNSWNALRGAGGHSLTGSSEFSQEESTHGRKRGRDSSDASDSGDCLFTSAGVARYNMLIHVQANWERFREIFQNLADTHFGGHLEAAYAAWQTYMQTEGPRGWGGEVEIEIAAIMRNRQIIVYTRQADGAWAHPHVHGPATGNPPVLLGYNGRHYVELVITAGAPMPAADPTHGAFPPPSSGASSSAGFPATNRALF